MHQDMMSLLSLFHLAGTQYDSFKISLIQPLKLDTFCWIMCVQKKKKELLSVFLNNDYVKQLIM